MSPPVGIFGSVDLTLPTCPFSQAESASVSLESCTFSHKTPIDKYNGAMLKKQVTQGTHRKALHSETKHESVKVTTSGSEFFVLDSDTLNKKLS